ncbi:MAG: efflux RND transporter periplasmic adaptor subunit [Cyanobacteria bacterium J06639_1]
MGKKRHPWRWAIAIALVGVTGAVVSAAIVRQRARLQVDVESLTVPVEMQSLAVRITASGKIQPVQTVNLSPKTTGILSELYVEQGDFVERGQLVARMESNTIAAELAQAQARLAQEEVRLDKLRAGNRAEDIAQARSGVERSRALIRQAEARLKLAEERVRRNRELVDEGAISRDSFDAVLNEEESARANLAQTQADTRQAEENLALLEAGSRAEDIAEAEARVQEAIANIQVVRVRQNDTEIRAPFSGLISQKFATEGAVVTPTTSASEAASATSTAIVAIASGLEVLAEVPEVDIGQIRVGQTVEVEADAFPERVFQGRVKLVAPEAVVQQNVTSFQVRVDLVTGLDVLRSGMNADVMFIGDRLQDALVVPTVAIVTQRGDTGVLVPGDNDRPRFTPVALGTAVGDKMQLLEGVSEGDRVFVELPPGQSLENLTFGRDR